MKFYQQCLSYAVAIASTAISLLLTFSVEPFMLRTIGAFFYIAIIVTAWYGGFRPGSVAVVLSTLAINYWFIPPRYQFWTERSQDVFQLAIFLLVALLINLFTLHFRDSKQKIERLSQQLAQENAEQLRMALSAAHMGMWDWNIVTGEINWSPEHEQLFGLTPGTFDGKYETFDTRLHPDDRKKLNQAVERSLRERLPYQHEYRVVWADGSVHWVEGRGQAFYDEAGQPVRMTGTVMAIDDRKQAQAALQEREAILRLFIHYAPAGIAMFDQDMRYIMASQRWVDDHSLDSIESLIHRSHYEIFPEVPERRRQIHQRCLAGAIEKCDEDLFVRADGRQQWISWEIHPWYTATDDIGGIIIFSVDVTKRKLAEAALRESQIQLQRQLSEIETIYQSAPIGLSILDTELRFVRINQRLAEINGLPVEAHIGRTVRELVPNLADAAEQLLRSILETGEPVLNVEITGETPAQPGVQRTWLESWLPLKDSEQIIGISIVCEEITERIQFEKALRRSEEQFRNMADNAPVMVWVTDATGYCTYLSQSWYEFTGQTEATGQGFGWLDALHPEDYALARDAFISANARQEAFRAEYRLRRQDGEYRFCLDAASPWFGADGQYKGYIGSVIDITERKLAEQTLAKELLRIQTVFDTSFDGIVILDGQGNVLDANPRFAQMLGYTPEETAKLSVFDWDAQFTHEELQQLLRDYISFKSGVLESRHRRKDGSIYDVEISVSVLEWEGEILRFCACRDISDRKLAQEALRQSEERYRMLFESIDEGFCVIEMLFDENNTPFDYRFLEINPQFEKQTGLEQAVGKTARQLLPNLETYWFEIYGKVALTGEPLRFENGSEAMNRWFDVYALRVGQASSRKVALVFQDITARKQAEMALKQLNASLEQRVADRTAQVREVNDRLLETVMEQQRTQLILLEQAQLLDLAHDTILTRDLNAVITFWNEGAEYMYGWSKAEALGQEIHTFLQTQFPKPLVEIESELLKRGYWEGELIHTRRDGTTITVASRWVMQKDDMGRPVKVLEINNDITLQKQAQAALHKYVCEIEDLYNNAPCGYHSLDASGNFIRINDTELNWLGYCRDEVLHKKFSDFLTAQGKQVFQENFPKFKQQGWINNLEFEIVGKDGTTRWISLNATAIKDEAGNFVMSRSTLFDISDAVAAATLRKQAEEALKKSEQALVEAQHLAHLGNWSFDVIKQELAWSDEVFRIYGLDPNQPEPTYEQYLQIIHPDDVELFQRNVELCITQGRAYEHEIRIFRPDSVAVAALGCVYKPGVPPHSPLSPEGAPSPPFLRGENSVKVPRDIKGVASSGFPLKKGDGRGIEEGDLGGSESDKVVCRRDLGASSSMRYTLGKGRAVFNEQGQVVKLFGTVQDISDRKLAESALQQAKVAAEAANQAKSTFLANMSHELRTPLNAILGFSQLMNRDTNLSPEQQENLRIITRSGEHLLTLINQVLDLAKIEAGRTTLNETAFDLIRLLDDLEDMFQLKAQQKGLHLICDRSDDVPQYVRGDELKLRQVLMNLLSNAIKFTKEGGISLRVTSRKPNGVSTPSSGQEQSTTEREQLTLYFEIEDTGPGIAPNELEKLFQAFIQTQTGSESQQGTGLGLIISRQFVKLMGGEITVSSSLGRGTLFKFDIHLGVADATTIKTKPPTRRVIALQPNQPSYRILIVDDRSDNRQLLIKLLNPLGFEIKEASNGVEAIKVWSNWEPHLIFMDMRMPVMDGYEASKRIKTTTQGQATAIVALSASSFQEARTVVFSVGCDDFIHKPFREADIFDALHKHIGVRYLYDEPPIELNTTSTQALTPEAIAALPTDWLASLQKAVIEGDLDLILIQIEQIRSQNDALANALASLAKKFQFKQLLTLIQPKMN